MKSQDSEIVKMRFSDSLILLVVVIYTVKADIETLKTIFQLKFDISNWPIRNCAAVSGQLAGTPLAPPQKPKIHQNIELAISFGEKLGEFAIERKNFPPH